MKDPWTWEEADVLSLIAGAVQESLRLEYKRCDSLQKTDGKKREISKDVSAFANSAGGVIVYGVEEDKHLPTGIDVGYDPSVISKEWLEQVINSTIERRIDSIRIKEVVLTGAKAGKAIYVVHIPQSRRAPHMAADNRYYKRFNFESVPMEDYEVKDVSRRFEVPDLHIGFRVETGGPLGDADLAAGRYKEIQVEVFVGNRSPAPADFALLSWSIDTRLRVSSNVSPDNSIRINNKTISVKSSEIEWRGGLRLPIWETTKFQLEVIPITAPVTGSPFYLFWEAQTPSMRRKTGAMIMASTGGILQFREEDLEWNFERQIFRKV